MKSENLAIGYSVLLEQTLKLSPDLKSANIRLYQLGRQMGLRMADEFSQRNCSFLSPAQTVKAMLVSICLDSFNLNINMIEESIRYEKRNHFYDLKYSQKQTNKSIFQFCQDIPDRFIELQPSQIVAGFLYGVLQSMDFYGKVEIQRDQNSNSNNNNNNITYLINVKKDIKQED